MNGIIFCNFLRAEMSGTTIIPVTISTTKKDKHKLATTIYHYKMLTEIGFQKLCCARML